MSDEDEKTAAVWEASPAQSHYMQCPVYEVLYAGEKGSGKTEGLVMEPFYKVFAQAQKRYAETGKRTHAWVLFLRKELGRLKEVIDRAKELFPGIDRESATRPGYGWSQQEKIYRFMNGFKFEFGHLEEPGSHLVYHGRQFFRVIIDEAPEIPPHQIAYMHSCIRVKKSDEPYLQDNLGIRLSGNPYGPFVAAIKKRFVDAGPPNTVVREEVELPDHRKVMRERVFIPARLKDNPHIDYDSYAASLAGLPEVMKRAFLYGDWDYVPGAYFDGFDDRIHVRKNIEPPPGSRIQRCGDWGSREPACCHWYTTDGDGNMIFLDELYGPGQDGPHWGQEILNREIARGWRSSEIDGHLDPGAFNDPGNSYPSPAEQMLAMGVVWYESDKSPGSIVLACVELTRRLAARTPAGMPGITIDARCKHLIEQIKKVQADQDNRDKIVEGRENHAFESARAGLLANPMPSEQPSLERELGVWRRIVAGQERQTGKNSWYPM